MGNTAPPGTVSSKSTYAAIPTTSVPSDATTALPAGIIVCHMSVVSCGRRSPKHVAASSPMAAQSESSAVRIVNPFGAYAVVLMKFTLTQRRSDST